VFTSSFYTGLQPPCEVLNNLGLQDPPDVGRQSQTMELTIQPCAYDMIKVLKVAVDEKPATSLYFHEN
jgi:hypothetical protein